MNFDEALQKHAAWKINFRTAINRHQAIDAVNIERDNCCVLGQWLYGDGKSKFGSKPEFQSLLDKHKAFHVEAGKVCQMINSQHYDDAERALSPQSPYAAASNAVTSALVTMRKIAGA
jgi:hypothetical protein